MLSSNFVLNASEKIDQYTIYPFIHCFSNVKSDKDVFQEVKLPDVCPNHEMGGNEDKYDFSMVAGEFMEVYG